MRIFLLMLFAALSVSSCSDDESPYEHPSYELTVGDSLITIPPEAVEFAGGRRAPGHFNWDAYMLREYQVAADPGYPHPGAVFTGSLADWKGRPWNERSSFLLDPYIRDINTQSAAQYYYYIGTYLEQFGYGWTDTYAADTDLWNIANIPWLHPSDSTLFADRVNTIEFDGESDFMVEYRGMWVVE